MSKAFYKSSVAPRLFHSMKVNGNSGSSTIEVWITTCIVTNFGKTLDIINKESSSTTTASNKPKRWTLINPSNPELSGCRKFPYFPRGGPVPEQAVRSMHKDWQPLGFVSQWGGMSVGTGMLYPVSTVDGLVHQRGGAALRCAIQMQRLAHHYYQTGTSSSYDCSSAICPVGRAVPTTAAGDLSEQYHQIVHTTPPFYEHHQQDPETALAQCYQSALTVAATAKQVVDDAHHHHIATPLLGAGCRGFPVEVACRVAARAVVNRLASNNSSSNNNTVRTVVAFGLLEVRTAEQLVEALRDAVEDEDA